MQRHLIRLSTGHLRKPCPTKLISTDPSIKWPLQRQDYVYLRTLKQLVKDGPQNPKFYKISFSPPSKQKKGFLLIEMWPIIAGFVRTYAVYITWPIAATVGFVGYNIESMMRKDKNPAWRAKSTQERRDERILEEMNSKDVTVVTSLKSKSDIPQTVLGRNDMQ